MTSKVIEDAKQAYQAWNEAPRGSYVERTLADAIVNDMVPALIHVAETRPQPIGFHGDDQGVTILSSEDKEEDTDD